MLFAFIKETKRYLITVTKNASIDFYRKRGIQMKREVFTDELKENVSYADGRFDQDYDGENRKGHLMVYSCIFF